MSLSKFHSIELRLPFLPDRQQLNAVQRVFNSMGCVAVCDTIQHTLEIDIPDKQWKHKEHIVEEEDI